MLLEDNGSVMASISTTYSMYAPIVAYCARLSFGIAHELLYMKFKTCSATAEINASRPPEVRLSGTDRPFGASASPNSCNAGEIPDSQCQARLACFTG